MTEERKINSALISVFSKDGLEDIVRELNKNNVTIYSTGGTQKYIESLGISVVQVEDLTSYPSILGGRVKTLHPKVFGGILSRRGDKEDTNQMREFDIPEIDLVIVDLYPFQDTVRSGSAHDDIIEKIDIGGISLIRAAAKNYADVLIVSNKSQYQNFLTNLIDKGPISSLTQRKDHALKAFSLTSNYDSEITEYFSKILSKSSLKELRYGENPHQKGWFLGDMSEVFEQLNGKQISYNNLLDIDAAVMLMEDFKNELPTFAILKHNNACGFSSRSTILEAYSAALAGDPISAFGGILISNKTIDLKTASQINELFCEVVIAPDYEDESLRLLKSKKNRIILKQKNHSFPYDITRSCLNGKLVQERDSKVEDINDFELKTKTSPTESQKSDLIFANKLAKHTKSNTIVLAKDKQLLASGTGQTSRVDALNQAINKAKSFGFDLNNAVMASDAFFPFPDCVEIASKEGINAVIQPGGSLKDNLSIDYCNDNNISMVFTGNRHFKH